MYPATRCSFCSDNMRDNLPMAEKIREEARALWAVRVLDTLATKHGRAIPTPSTYLPHDGTWYLQWKPFSRVEGVSPSAARIAAAEEMVAEDPTLGAFS